MNFWPFPEFNQGEMYLVAGSYTHGLYRATRVHDSLENIAFKHNAEFKWIDNYSSIKHSCTVLSTTPIPSEKHNN